MIKPTKVSLLLVALSLIGCNQLKLDSNWNDDAMAIDGDLGEWTEGLQVPPETELAIAVRNDSDHLYLALRTHDQDLIRQVVMTGFTLWLDPDGGKNKVLGISCPQSVRHTHPQLQAQLRNQDPAMQLDLLKQQLLAQTEVLLTDEDDRVTRLNPQNTEGIQVAISLDNWILQYELRVPLTEDWHNRLELAAEPGATIGIGLTTPKPDRPQRPGGMSGGGRSGGRHGSSPGGAGGGKGGGMRGGGPGGGGRPEMGTQQAPDPLKLWFKVVLAENSGS